MSKKINKKIMFNFDMTNELYDSPNEIHFHWFLQELQYYGYIDEIVLQPDAFILSNPIRIK